MVALLQKDPSIFSYQRAQLYKNIETCQLVLACPITIKQIETVKTMKYIYKLSSIASIMANDYIVLDDGRLSIVYQHMFNAEHIRLGASQQTTVIGYSGC